MTTRAQAEIDIKAIHSVVQERQLKMMLDHDLSRRAKKARPLVVGERCYVLGPGNKWIDDFITGITDSGRSYETQVELLEMEHSFNTLLAGTRDKQGHPVTRSQMDNLRDQQQRIAVLKEVAMQP